MPASTVRARSRVAASPKPTPVPAPTEAAITRMLAQPAPAAHPDEALLALGRRFDELHTAWMVTVEADREPTERFNAHIAAAKARGGTTVKDHEAAWALPGVMASHDREFEAFGKLDPLFKAIVAMPAETIDGLAVKARALVAGSWPNGNYFEDRHLGSDEDWPLDLIRNLIEATCRLAGVDWRGQPIAVAPVAPRAVPEASLADQILACWQEWSARPDFDESPEADRLSDWRSALIDAAEALPATPENILPKALASAWLEYVGYWGNGQAREEYGTDGRLALDIDTAICGRLKTHYVKAGA